MRKFYFSLFFAFACFFSFSGNLFAQSFPGSVINISTSGTSTNSGTATVSGVGTISNGSNVILHVQFNHSWVSDLGIWLVAPSGEVLELFTGNGGGNNNGDITFSDNGTVNITAVTVTTSTAVGGCPPASYAYNGTYKPEGRNNAIAFPPTAPSNTNAAGTYTFANTFTGVNADGIWTLYMNDHAGGDGGASCVWNIDILSPCTTPPLGGTTASSSNPSCPNVNFILSVTSGAFGTGLTYQWESSPDGSIWSDISGATAETYTTSQTAATWYRRKTTCSGIDGFSTGLQVTMSPPASCYCSAGATSTSFEKISNVTFNTINNSSVSTAGYEDFTAVSTTVTAGAAYPVTVSISGGFSTDEVIIFIDFNQDGDFFDAGETVYTSSLGAGPHSGNITIPTSAVSGNTRMRVRMHDSSLGANGTSCGTSSYGQVEDYTINVFIPPCIITCPANITVTNDPDQCGAIVNYPAPTTSGICGPVTTSPASGSFFPIGTTTVTATEPGGGVCSFTITVNDIQIPVITCPSDVTVSNTPGQCGANVTLPTPVVSDNCPGVIITYSPASGSFFSIGTTTVTTTATDASGNSASCTFTVTVNDTENPTINCPGDITVNNDAGICGAVVNYDLPSINDNCPLPGQIELSQSLSNTIVTGSVSCNLGGLHADNSYWRAYDLSTYGLSGPITLNSVTFGIELADAAGATQPVVVRLYTSAGAFPGGTLTQVASENVDVPDQTNSLFTVNLTTPPNLPANAILVLELFTPDGQTAGNSFFIGSNSAGQTGPSYITAADCGAPTPVTLASLGFPNMHIVLNASGIVAGPSAITQLAGIPSGSTFPIGTTTNTFQVTDNAGNTSTCSFDVTVNDSEAPVITCPGNMTVTTPIGSCTATVNYTVTSTDNCPGVTQALQSGLASGSAFPLGVNTVSWQATDAAGNTSTCSFTVTVLDGQLPVISVQPANTTACEGDNASFSVTATNVLSYQWQMFNGSIWNNIAGANSSSYTANNVTTASNTNSYRVVLTGLCTIVTSNHASVYVNTLPDVQLTAAPSPVLLPNQMTTITATTNPSGGSYVWTLNGSLISPSGASLPDLGIDDIGSYMLVYTDPNGCVGSSSIDINAAPSAGLWIYPSPNTGSFQVRYYNSVSEPATINVFNSKGEKVYHQSIVTSIPYSQINVSLNSAISSGIYLVELVNGSGKRIGAKRIMVQK